MAFTDCYTQQSCTAGRAAFISGSVPVRSRMTKVGLPGAKEGWQMTDVTMATVLKSQGYATGQFGKNHQGDRNERHYHNHIDGYNLLDYLSGKTDQPPRQEFLYVNDDGQIIAIRYDAWKAVFLENRGVAFGVWREPFTELRDGKPVLVRLPEISFVGDKAGKPVGIDPHIGRRPIIAFGNSDGDFEMLEWTTGGRGPRFGLLVHHTDAEREWAYDRESPVGKLDRGLDKARARGWAVVSMKDDWKEIHPVEPRGPTAATTRGEAGEIGTAYSLRP